MMVAPEYLFVFFLIWVYGFPVWVIGTRKLWMVNVSNFVHQAGFGLFAVGYIFYGLLTLMLVISTIILVEAA